MSENVLIAIFSAVAGLFFALGGFWFKVVFGFITELRKDNKAHAVQIAQLETASMDQSRKVEENRTELRAHDRRIDSHDIVIEHLRGAINKA